MVFCLEHIIVVSLECGWSVIFFWKIHYFLTRQNLETNKSWNGNPNETKNNREKMGIGKVLMFLFTGVRIEYYKAIMCEAIRKKNISSMFVWPKKPPELRTWTLLSSIWDLSEHQNIIHGILFRLWANLQFLCMSVQNKNCLLFLPTSFLIIMEDENVT